MLRSCGTCRTRRRACDKARPSCETCKRSGRLCTGYDAAESKIFVNFDSQNLSKRKKRVLCDAIRVQHEITARSKESKKFSDEEVRKSSGNRNSSPVYVHALSPPPSPPPPPPPSSSLQPWAKLPQRDINVLAATDIRVTFLNCLNMSVGVFHEHLSTLWHHLQQGHTMTPCGWAPSFGALILINRSLDLALVGLSALRLAQTGKEEVRVMALSAYHHGLQLFRKICNNNYQCNNGTIASVRPDGDFTKADRRRSALLSVTSLVFAFFEASHENAFTIFTRDLVAHNPHMAGCMVFVRAAGPQPFSTGGAHRAFRKIREMSLHASLAKYEPSFLASSVWINEPWRYYGKTIRDQLFDILTQLTALSAYTLSNKPAPFKFPRRWQPSIGMEEEDVTPTRLYFGLQRALQDWMHNWLSPRTFEPQAKMVKPALVDRHDADLDPRQILLHTEMRSVRLLMALVGMKLGELEGCSPQPDEGSTQVCGREGPFAAGEPFGLDPRQAREDAIVFARAVNDALKDPVFNLHNQFSKGIVEGQCRSIFPTWCLMEFDKIMKREPEPYDICLDGLAF